MELFKRNQVEEAIFAGLESRLREPTPEFRTRVKRLLDMDRALGRAPRSTDPERRNYAFYSDDPPGSGVEIWFSAYEALALSFGLQLMAHGWTQGFVVSVMRHVRIDLEQAHADILKRPWKRLTIDEQKRGARPGDVVFNVADPVFLVIVPSLAAALEGERKLPIWKVCPSDDDAMQFAWAASGGRGGWTVFEIVDVSHALLHTLRGTEARRRGRS